MGSPYFLSPGDVTALGLDNLWPGSGQQGGSVGPDIVTDPGQAPAINQPANSSGLTWDNLQLPSLSGISPASFSGASGGSPSGFGGTTAQPNGAPAWAIGQPSNAQAGAQPQPTTGSSGIVTGSWFDYFMRGVVIIVGFIFLAIGLNMFRPGTIPMPIGHK